MQQVTTNPPRKRLTAADRKSTILTAAKRLFAEKGFHGVSVDMIARKVGISPAILYRHFPSKEALYEELLNMMSCKRVSYVEAVVQEPSDFASVLHRLTQVYVLKVAEDPDYLRMEMHGALEGGGITQQFYEHRWKSFSDYIETGLQDLLREHRAHCTDARAAVLMFHGMIREALYAKCIFDSSRYRDTALADLVRSLVDLFLHAIDYRVATPVIAKLSR
jgi:AcrR family transcriptional regulator